MPSNNEHHFCQPVMYRKKPEGPAKEAKGPFYLVRFGKIANIYTEQDKERVLEIARKGGCYRAYSSYDEVFAAHEDFCGAYHPDDVHNCISSHYRVPLHRILHYFRGTETDNLDPHSMMILPDVRVREITDDGDDEDEDGEDEDGMDVEVDHALNVPDLPATLLAPINPTVADATSTYDVAQPSFLDEWESLAYHPRCMHFMARGVPQPYYMLRTSAGWSFIFACRIDALALFIRFLRRGLNGDFRQYTMAELHGLHENNGRHVLNYGVHGWSRFGVLNDRDSALRLLQSEAEDWHSSALMVTSDFMKARQWAYQVHEELADTTHERFEVAPDDIIF